jgi:hypothetical protein
MESVEHTSIRLIAKDGPFTVTFRPSLTPEQYADLNQVVSTGAEHTKARFCEKFKAMATVWEVQFESDGACDEDN